MKKNKKTIVILVILAIGLLYWFVIRPKMKARKSVTSNQENLGSSSGSSSINVGGNSGSSSGSVSCSLSRNTVGIIQQACNRVLRKQGKTILIVDKIYGPKTDKAVKSIAGKSCASYSEVKAGVIKWFTDNGHGNPYTSIFTAKTVAENSDDDNKSVGWWLNHLTRGGLDRNILTPY